MADGVACLLGPALADKVAAAKVLVVGAGGIGCELLKTLVMTGFVNIEVVDLDTIDVSNLNRQFLFQKQHVGMSKAKVAAEAVKKFNPKANVVAHHADIKTEDFGVDFVSQFDIVLNALDNVSARKYMNRLCLAADKPLVESGTAGYLGQVTVIRKGKTECFECHPKPPPKTFPVCTIRNTPTLPIHCIVWAKFLFHQLFGHADDENSVSPNMDDPDAAHHAAGAGTNGSDGDSNGNGNGATHKEMALRHWAKHENYSPTAIFDRIFCKDIETLLSMSKLWEKRKPPTPLHFDALSDVAPGSATAAGTPALAAQRVWSPKESAEVFLDSIKALQTRREESGNADVELDWDKDDKDAMDFVAAAANLRAFAFDIPLKSLFDIKSMAGNIIPAIATTNAVIGGLIVVEALNILGDRFDRCKASYLWQYPNAARKLLVPARLDVPNPQCYVCADKPEVTLLINLDTATLEMLRDRVLRSKLNMVSPDVNLGDRIIISSEEDDNSPEYLRKTLREIGMHNVSVLDADDFLQKYKLRLNVRHSDQVPEEEEFHIVGGVGQIEPAPEPEPTPKVHERVKTPADAIILDGADGAGADEATAAVKRPAEMMEHEAAGTKRARVVEEDMIVLD